MEALGLCAFADAFNLTPETLTEETVKQLYRRAHFAPKTDEVFGAKMAALDCALKDRIKFTQDAVCE